MSSKNPARPAQPFVCEYTVPEEIANAITHGIGTALAIAGLVVLVVMASLAGDPWRIVSFSIYGATLIIAYLTSTLYHGVPSPRAKAVLQICDHCSIYALIAGTYTPILLVSRSAWSWVMFGVIWGLALIGIAIKASRSVRFRKISTLSYIGMGWLCVLAWGEIASILPLGGLVWLIVGGVVYTAGVLFYRLDNLPFNHAIWHGFVLGGSVCHFMTMALFLAPAA